MSHAASGRLSKLFSLGTAAGIGGSYWIFTQNSNYRTARTVGAGLLEEENGWCWYVTCMDCGSHTASFEFKTPQESEEAAGKAAHLWNIGKVVRGDIGE